MIQTKYFESSFSLIEQLYKDKVASCKGLPFVLSDIAIKRNSDGNLIITGKTPYTDKLDKQISRALRFQIIYSSAKKYVVLESHAISRQYEYIGDYPTSNILLQIKITKLKSLNTRSNTKKYHRFFIPCAQAEKWMRDICTYGYMHKTLDKGRNGYASQLGVFKVTTDEQIYEIYPLKKEVNTFLVIDSVTKCTEQDIQNFYNAVALALNWLLDIKSGGIVCIIGSNNNEFRSGCLLSITQRAFEAKNNYPLFTTNMYSLWDYMKIKRIKTKAAGDLKNSKGGLKAYLQDWLHEEELSNIVNILYKNPILARAIYMCVSASSAPLEYQPALMSVALETITTYYDIIHSEDIKTVLPKSKWKPICRTLLNALQGLNLPDEIYNNYKIRIEGDINRKLNSQKLSKPFETIEYNLSELENKAIRQRNDFLHGRFEDQETETKRINGELPPLSMDEEYQLLITASVVLHRLCSVFVLKLSKFHGYIINYLLFYHPSYVKGEKMLIKV